MVWEERWHPLRREWVIVSSHRNDFPESAIVTNVTTGESIERIFTTTYGTQVDWTPNFTLDWRWFCEPVEDTPLPSERSLIDWPLWARPKIPRRGSSAPR